MKYFPNQSIMTTIPYLHVAHITGRSETFERFVENSEKLEKFEN
jgi:hypothetical protein